LSLTVLVNIPKEKRFLLSYTAGRFLTVRALLIDVLVMSYFRIGLLHSMQMRQCGKAALASVWYYLSCSLNVLPVRAVFNHDNMDSSSVVFVVYSDIDEDVRSLKQFSTALVVEATARCLHTIDSSLDVQYRLPPSMAAQFRIGTSLATAVQVRFADAHCTVSSGTSHTYMYICYLSCKNG